MAQPAARLLEFHAFRGRECRRSHARVMRVLWLRSKAGEHSSKPERFQFGTTGGVSWPSFSVQNHGWGISRVPLWEMAHPGKPIPPATSSRFSVAAINPLPPQQLTSSRPPSPAAPPLRPGADRFVIAALRFAGAFLQEAIQQHSPPRAPTRQRSACGILSDHPKLATPSDSVRGYSAPRVPCLDARKLRRARTLRARVESR